MSAEAEAVHYDSAPKLTLLGPIVEPLPIRQPISREEALAQINDPVDVQKREDLRAFFQSVPFAHTILPLDATDPQRFADPFACTFTALQTASLGYDANRRLYPLNSHQRRLDLKHDAMFFLADRDHRFNNFSSEKDEGKMTLAQQRLWDLYTDVELALTHEDLRIDFMVTKEVMQQLLAIYPPFIDDAVDAADLEDATSASVKGLYRANRVTAIEDRLRAVDKKGPSYERRWVEQRREGTSENVVIYGSYELVNTTEEYKKALEAARNEALDDYIAVGEHTPLERSALIEIFRETARRDITAA